MNQESTIQPASGRGLLFPLLAAIPVMLTFVTFPNAPVELNTDADTSFIAVLDFGLRHGLYSGSDLVHVYGPLGHLIFYYFAPHTAWIRYGTDLALSYTVASGLCLMAWQLPRLVAVLLLGLFVYITPNVYPRGDLVIDAGLFCWGLLCCVDSSRRLRWSAVMFTALAIFSTLAKNSFLFSSGCSLALVGMLLVTKGSWRVAISMVAGFCAGVFAGWLALGPPLSHWPETVSNTLAIVRLYNEASGWDTLPLTLYAGLAVVALAAAMILFRAASAFDRSVKARSLARTFLLLWLFAMLFFEWKHGFVRGDLWHVGYFFGFMPVLALGLEILPNDCALALRWARGLAIACCAICLFALQITYFPPLSQALMAPIHSFLDHTRDIFTPRDFQRRMNDAIEADRQKADLPHIRGIVGNASVDVFGFMQAYALLNGFNYHPRPVFQSHAAGGAQLAALNERFYLSTNAPDYLMFRLAPIDRRFPALEDPMLFRDILFNFELVAVEHPFLLLKSKSIAQTQLTLLREGQLHPGEILSLANYAETNLWLELDVQPTLAGRLRQFFYRAPTVRLAAWGESRLLLKRRAPPLLLAAGFLASPFIARNEDLAGFYQGGPIIRPAGYSVEMLPGEEFLWQNSIHFRLYEIENSSTLHPK